jgi:hypothetical protein
VGWWLVARLEMDTSLCEKNVKLYQYIGRVTIEGDVVIVTPCRGISDRQLDRLKQAHQSLRGQSGWKQTRRWHSVLVRVDIDDTSPAYRRATGVSPLS